MEQHKKSIPAFSNEFHEDAGGNGKTLLDLLFMSKGANAICAFDAETSIEINLTRNELLLES